MTGEQQPSKTAEEAWNDARKALSRMCEDFGRIAEQWRRTVSVLLPLPDEPDVPVWSGEGWRVELVSHEDVSGEVVAFNWDGVDAQRFAAALIAADRARTARREQGDKS